VSLSADCYACLGSFSDADYHWLLLSAHPERCSPYVHVELSTLSQSQVTVVDENLKTSVFEYLTESRWHL